MEKYTYKGVKALFCLGFETEAVNNRPIRPAWEFKTSSRTCSIYPLSRHVIRRNKFSSDYENDNTV